MRSLTMDHPLTIDAIARSAETLANRKPIYGYEGDGTLRETTWGETIRRARALASGLSQLGVSPGDRVATLAWNTIEHLEAYFAVPIMGNALHTMNTRLSTADNVQILRDAGSRVLIVDQDLVAAADELRSHLELDHVIITGDDVPAWALRYDDVVDRGRRARFDTPYVAEDEVCSLCYTTGTTGAPKGVTYSHRALSIQSLVLMSANLEGIREDDVVLVVVPMFHANAWGHPYAAALAGASLVLPHRDLSAPNLLGLIEHHRVTHTGGIATVWGEVLKTLDADPSRFDTTSLRLLRFGGAKAPMAMLRAFEERHGIHVVHGWGMTELSPMGAMAVPTAALRQQSTETQWRARAKQGRPIPFLEVRARASDGELAVWDGQTPGELEVRGPSVASGYLHGRAADSFTSDGWLRTGDIVTIDRDGYVEIVDRAKDMIKSGGEWISSLALEESLAEHPAVLEAAVIGVLDPQWGERPLAVVVPRIGVQAPAPGELADFLRQRHPSWWVPERFEFVGHIVRAGKGKVSKLALRATFDPARARSPEERPARTSD